MSERLLEKTAVVSGATRGIGRAITDLFLENGAKVAGIYLESDDEAERLASEAPNRFLPVKFDLTDVDRIPEMVRRFPSEFRDIDILVNNAGTKLRTPFFDTSTDIWEQTMALNLRAPYFLSLAIARGMVERGQGRIINISSQASPNLTPDSLEYGISKSGLVHVTKTLAKVLAPSGVTVNAVSPGRTYTDLSGYEDDPEKEANTLQNIPLQHINRPSEVADVALFLAADTGNNITGQVVAIDGGEVVA